jgi:hypothetical protein
METRVEIHEISVTSHCIHISKCVICHFACVAITKLIPVQVFLQRRTNDLFCISLIVLLVERNEICVRCHVFIFYDESFLRTSVKLDLNSVLQLLCYNITNGR